MLALQQSETYKRHRPETTLLYSLVERYYPVFTANLAEQGKYLPKYVEREFDEFLFCAKVGSLVMTQDESISKRISTAGS